MNATQISNSVKLIIFISIAENLNNSNILSDFQPTLAYYVAPVHYDIKLSLVATKSNFSTTDSSNIRNEYVSFFCHGESRITINILQSMRNITLHTSNLGVNDGKITMVKNNGETYKLRRFFYSFTMNSLELQFYDILYPGLYTLKINTISYITPSDAENFFRSSYINKEESLILLIAPYSVNGARQMFPCWDEPHLKTTFTISVKHDRKFKALSNMPTHTHYADNDDLIWTHFYTTPAMSTYEVSVILTNFPRIRINANISLWCEKCLRPLSLKYVKQIIQNITLHFESKGGIFEGIRLPKMDHIVVPNFLHNNTMKRGLIFHREADLIYDEKLGTIMPKIEIARNIAHKIAYQWFGNTMNLFWLSEFWLHDSLAILFAEEAVVKIFNNSQIMDLFIVQNQYESLHLDSHFNMNPSQINSLSKIDSIFEFPRYMKVLVVLRMLQNAVTDVTFRKGVRIYLYKNMFDPVSSFNFWSIQEDLTKTLYTCDFPSWLMYRHYPVVSWKQKNPSWGMLSQNFKPRESSSNKWCIPTNIMTKKSLPRTVELWLTPQMQHKYVNYVPEDNWIMVDIRQAGYYRINYESKNWRKIARYLKSEQYKNISVINRAKIIDDAFHFMITQQLNAPIFWELTKFLSQETDYVAWYPMIKIFEYISNVLPLSKNEINFTHIKKKMRDILSKPLERLGIEERPTENEFTKYLRQEIAKWACTAEHSECLQMAKFKLEQHLKYPEIVKVLPGWKEWLYCKGFMTVETNTWPYLKEIWPNKAGDKYIEYFPCFQDTSITHALFEFLEFKNSNESKKNARKQDINMSIKIFHSIIAKHKNDETFENVLFHFMDSKPNEISKAAALINIINHVYSTKQLERISFFLLYEKQINLGKLTPKVYHKIHTRMSQIERQIVDFHVLLD